MKLVYFLLALSLILAGCSSAPQTASRPTPVNSSSTVSDQPAPTATASPKDKISPAPQPSAISPSELARTDEQGMVTVEVTPVNLTDGGETLEFEIGLNTHSVDLSMDLASLATLTTDTGEAVQAGQWDAPKGGHHVSGKLIFPATIDGQPLLNGAKKLTLTIKNLDVPERLFAWDLNP